MSTPADRPRDPSETPPSAGTCPVAWCPVCLAVSAVQPLSPAVVSHLLTAGTELFLAFRSAIEGRGEELRGEGGREPVRLEKIDVG